MSSVASQRTAFVIEREKSGLIRKELSRLLTLSERFCHIRIVKRQGQNEIRYLCIVYLHKVYHQTTNLSILMVTFGALSFLN